MLEKHFERRVTSALSNLGVLSIKIGYDGWADRIYLLRGHVVFVEFKSDTGSLSPSQSARLAWLKKNGFNAMVVFGFDNVNDVVQAIYVKLLERRKT